MLFIGPGIIFMSQCSIKPMKSVKSNHSLTKKAFISAPESEDALDILHSHKNKLHIQ